MRSKMPSQFVVLCIPRLFAFLVSAASPLLSLSLYPSWFLFFFFLSPLRRMSNVLKIAGFFALPQGLKCQQAHCHSKRFTSFSFIIVCLHLQQAHASLLNHSHKKTVVIQLIAVTHLWPSDIESVSLSQQHKRTRERPHTRTLYRYLMLSPYNDYLQSLDFSFLSDPSNFKPEMSINIEFYN